MKPELLQSPGLRLITLGLALLWPSALQADVITPVAWKQSNAASAARTAAKLGNATGMDGAQTLLYNHDGSLPGEPISADNSQWNCRSESFSQTVLNQRRVWIVVDLGAVYDLTTLKIWNYNWDNSPGTPLTSLNDRGISQFDVYVRYTAADTNNGTPGGTPINTGTVDAILMTYAPAFNLGTSNPWELVLSDQGLLQAPNTDDYAGESYDLTGNTGRFIAIVADGWYGGVSAGLGKVRIEGTPLPPTGGWAVDGGGSFNLNTNWSDNSVPTTNAIFGNFLTAPNAPALVTLDSPASVNQVSFQNLYTYSLDGPSTLTLTGSAVLNASPSASTHLITAPVDGSNGVTKTGPGVVALVNPNNSYTGNTTVTEGILAATDLGAINQASGGIDIAAGAAFALAGDGLGNGATGILTEVIQGAGNLIVDRSLTTEEITLGSANPLFTGQVQINGGKLKPGDVGALGDTTGTTLVTGGDDFDTSALWLDGITITGETLGLNARKESAAAAPHLISTGTSGWTGPIQGNTGGPNYNIQSQSGLLTLSGTIDAPDGTLANDPAIPVNGDRIFNFTGDGDIRIEGQITDIKSPTSPTEGGNIALTKVGTGTLTIATIPTFTPGEGYHQGRTVIDGGTLAVQESGTNNGELFSRTIEVAAGATFDISSFTEYELQQIESGLGQVISGAGTVDLGGTGSELILFSDSTISPGDRNGQNVLVGTNSIGTLTIDGDVSDEGGSTFLMEIAGDATNDRVDISGTASLSATINVTGVPTGPISNGTVFTLISAAGGLTSNGISFGPLPSPNLSTNITATEVRLIWNDLNAPTVTFSPNAVTEVAVTTNLVATFNERVLIGSGDILIINLTDNVTEQTIGVDDDTRVSLSPSGLVLTINPALNLKRNKQYAIQIAPTAITDISGNGFAGIVAPDVTTWAFTTTAFQSIVVENFTSSSGLLNGTSADIFASGITSAGGSATWVASNSFLENGAVNVATNTAAYLNLGSYVNATKGTDAGKFKLAMTISETTGTWISLGFAVENAPSTARNFTNTGSGTATTNGLGTIVYRAQTANPLTTGELDMWGGPGSATGAVDGPEPNTGTRLLTVELDLTPAGGYNGTNNFGKVTWFDAIRGQLGSYTYTANRNFGAILITQATNTSGTIGSLVLSQGGLPEPPENTYQSWIGGFAFAGFVNPNLTATGDPDNDGLPNAVENLLGTSPEVFNQGLTSVSTSGGNLVFRHTLSTTPASDLAGAYEWSTNLVNWNADGASAGATTVTFSNPPVVITPGTPNLVQVTATVTGTPLTKVFVRFKATSL
jgi:autotransporter-associated beta strand protein